MSPKGEADLVRVLEGIRGDLNRNFDRLAAELVNLTQEVFLSRKAAELLISEAARAELAALDRRPAPSPDLEHQEEAQAAAPTQAQIDEINRALFAGDMELGPHGLPVNGAR